VRLICRFIVYNTAPTPSHDQTLNLPPPMPIVCGVCGPSDRRKLARPDRRETSREDRGRNIFPAEAADDDCIVFAVGGSRRPRKWTRAEGVKYTIIVVTSNTNLHTVDRVYLHLILYVYRHTGDSPIAWDRALFIQIIIIIFFFFTYLSVLKDGISKYLSFFNE
jgi:hypothetical protein